jgi:hypothetical protein
MTALAKYFLVALVLTLAVTSLGRRLPRISADAAPQAVPPRDSCPWQAWVEIVDCQSLEVTGWRVSYSPREDICVGETLPDLLEQARDLYQECLGDRQCREYKWCA